MTEEYNKADTRAAAGPSSIPPPDIGRTRIGRYEIIYPIAQGGMAGVWAGRFSGIAGFEKLVAIKVIHSHLSKNPEFVKMFLDEARLAARIHHPNLGEVFEVGEEDGLYYMASELILGQNLRRLMVRAKRHGVKVPLDVCAGIAARVCYGLDKAHKLQTDDGRPMNLVHRDVSPQNILISYDGHVKLIDFGVAFAKDRITSTDVGTVKGKVRYMAPEQIRAESVDGRTDLFALGIVLHQMVLGRHPFPGGNDAQRINRILCGDYIPPQKVDSNLPEDLCRIIETAIQNWPENRFASGADMGEALDDFVASTGAKSVPVTLSKLMHELFSGDQPRHWRRLREHDSKVSKKLDLIEDNNGVRPSQPTLPINAMSRSPFTLESKEDPADAKATTLWQKEESASGSISGVVEGEESVADSTAGLEEQEVEPGSSAGHGGAEEPEEPEADGATGLGEEEDWDDDDDIEEKRGTVLKTVVVPLLIVAALVILGWQLLKPAEDNEPQKKSTTVAAATLSPKPEKPQTAVDESKDPPPVLKTGERATPAQVTIPLEVFPATSQLELDGVRLKSGTSVLRLTVDGKPHTFAVSAEGYRSEERTFVAKEGDSLSVHLNKRSVRKHRRPQSGKKKKNRKVKTTKKKLVNPESLRSNPYQ